MHLLQIVLHVFCTIMDQRLSPRTSSDPQPFTKRYRHDGTENPSAF